MSEFVTGIDDIATMSGKCKGWTFISFDSAFHAAFLDEAHAILKKSGLTSFHAKEFKRRKYDYYIQFLDLIKSILKKSESFLCYTLLGQDWKDEFCGFCDRVIAGSFSNAGIDNDNLVEASKRIAAPLFTYQRLSNHVLSGGRTSIDIDRDSILDKLSETQLVVDGRKISNQVPIFAALKAYGCKFFPSAPQVERDRINVLQDEESFLIQAADIFGNFANAIVFQSLGKKSKSNDLKCEAFNQVFGDIVDPSQLPNAVTLAGDDIELKGAVSFTQCINSDRKGTYSDA